VQPDEGDQRIASRNGLTNVCNGDRFIFGLKLAGKGFAPQAVHTWRAVNANLPRSLRARGAERFAVQLLHFSDTHNNKDAMTAVAKVAARWKDSIVVVTGDVCSLSEPYVSSVFDDLPNHRVFLVRGNHDKSPEIQFSRLERTQWEAPYFEPLGYSALIGLDSELNPRLSRIKEVGRQLSEIEPSQPFPDVKTLIVLHHTPYAHIRGVIIDWAKNHFPNIVSLALLHGHAHKPRDFYAQQTYEKSNGLYIYTSHVYSANNRHEYSRFLGCGHLLDCGKNGEVSIALVMAPSNDHS
jgi:hypothetical protein